MKLCFLILIVLAVPRLSIAQPSLRKEAEQVMHCIKNGDRDWLAVPFSEAREFRVGLVHDLKSYPGSDHIILAVFEAQLRGQVFSVLTAHKDSHKIYKIENNGTFQIQGKEVAFIDAPLGGVWTQRYLTSNIRKILAGPKLSIPLSASTKPFPDVQCSSYAAQSE